MAINYEKILGKLLAAVERLPDEQRDAFNYYTANAAELHKCAGYNAGFALADLAADIREGIAQQTAKTAGRGSARKAAHPSTRAPRAHARQIRPPAGRGRVSPFCANSAHRKSRKKWKGEK